jgi:chromosomal replication initiation ATPase DnaA
MRPGGSWPSAFKKLPGLQRVTGARAISFRGHPGFTLIITSLAPAFAWLPLLCPDSRGRRPMPDLRRQISDPTDLGETASSRGGAGTGEAWMRIRRRLRAELGEVVFSSWFGCLELDALADQDVYLSVPTKFLKSWIQSHYMDRILPALASEFPAIKRVSINVRSSTRPATACATVAAKLVHQTFEVPAAVVAYVASVIRTNGRDLDGAVNRLLAHASLNGAELRMETAELAIRDLVRTPDPKKVKIEDIQKLVASHFNVSRGDILSARRTASVVRPRQIAMYLSKLLTPRSLPEIGRRFGGRDHTTVLHAVRKITGLVTADGTLSEEIELLKRMLLE